MHVIIHFQTLVFKIKDTIGDIEKTIMDMLLIYPFFGFISVTQCNVTYGQ